MLTLKRFICTTSNRFEFKLHLILKQVTEVYVYVYSFDANKLLEPATIVFLVQFLNNKTVVKDSLFKKCVKHVSF